MPFDIQYYSPQLLKAYGQIAHEKGVDTRKEKEQAQKERERALDLEQQKIENQRLQQQEEIRLRQLRERRLNDIEDLKNKAQQNQFDAIQQQYAPQMQGKFDYLYTPSQRRKVSQLSDALQNVYSDPRLRPDQRNQLANRILQQLNGIRPAIQLPDQNQPNVRREFMNRVMLDPNTGNTYILQPDGKIDHLVKNKSEELTYDTMAKMWDVATKMLITQDGDGHDIMPSSENVQKLVQTMIDEAKIAMGKMKKVIPTQGQPVQGNQFNPSDFAYDPNASVDEPSTYNPEDLQGMTPAVRSMLRIPENSPDPTDPLNLIPPRVAGDINLPPAYEGVVFTENRGQPGISSPTPTPTPTPTPSSTPTSTPSSTPPSIGTPSPVASPFATPGESKPMGIPQSGQSTLSIKTVKDIKDMKTVPKSNEIDDITWAQFVGANPISRQIYNWIFLQGKNLDSFDPTLWNQLSRTDQDKIIMLLSRMGVLRDMKKMRKQ